MGPDQALVTSIGEQILAYVGKDSIAKLVVTMSTATNEVEVVMNPRDSSMESQLRIMGIVANIEDMFADDVAMTVRLETADSAAFNISRSMQLAFTA